MTQALPAVPLKLPKLPAMTYRTLLDTRKEEEQEFLAKLSIRRATKHLSIHLRHSHLTNPHLP